MRCVLRCSACIHWLCASPIAGKRRDMQATTHARWRYARRRNARCGGNGRVGTATHQARLRLTINSCCAFFRNIALRRHARRRIEGGQRGGGGGGGGGMQVCVSQPATSQHLSLIAGQLCQPAVWPATAYWRCRGRLEAVLPPGSVCPFTTYTFFCSGVHYLFTGRYYILFWSTVCSVPVLRLPSCGGGCWKFRSGVGDPLCDGILFHYSHTTDLVWKYLGNSVTFSTFLTFTLLHTWK